MSMVRIPVEPRITEYLHRKASAAGTPLSGTFELTPTCNMNCRMCYVRMSQAQQQAIAPLRTTEEWLALGREAMQQGMLYLLLTGGEPFMLPNFRQILAGLHQMGLVISINSNGTLIDEQTVEWLKQTPPTRINITLYGASDATYGRLCRNPQGFTQVTRAIRLLKEAGILVKLNCSVTPYNAADLEQIVAFARSEQLVVQPTSYMFPPLRRDASKIGWNDRFDPEEAAYQAARIEALLNGPEEFIQRAKTMDLSLSGEVGDDCPDLGEGEGIRCRAGKCSFWVTWDGRLLPCGMLPDQGERVFELGFAEAWRRVRASAAAIRLPAKCKTCPQKEQCRACAAMVVTESGNFSTVPEYRCRMSHAYPAACAKLAAQLAEEEGK